MKPSAEGHVRRASRTIALGCALAIGASACYVETESPKQSTDVQPTTPPPSETPAAMGKLVVHFTISGGTDPNECVKSEAKDFELTLTNAEQTAPKGVPGGVWRHTCEAFALSVTLRPATYTGSAVLLDNLHTPRTTRVNLGTFTIRPNETLDVKVNFPATSFLKSP